MPATASGPSQCPKLFLDPSQAPNQYNLEVRHLDLSADPQGAITTARVDTRSRGVCPVSAGQRRTPPGSDPVGNDPAS